MTDARSDWRLLLDLALPALDHVFKRPRPDGTPDWTLGGGTALAIQLGHRVSHDIDIFLQRGTQLKLFTPAHNPAAARISSRFQWPGHYLKFERAEGEIDFLGAGLLTTPGYIWQSIGGRVIALETLEEVIMKKARYRADHFTARDAFDLAAVAAVRPRLDRVMAAEVGDALPRLTEALRVLEAKGPRAIEAAITPTGMGIRLLPDVLSVARQVTDRASALASASSHAIKGPGVSSNSSQRDADPGSPASAEPSPGSLESRLQALEKRVARQNQRGANRQEAPEPAEVPDLPKPGPGPGP